MSMLESLVAVLKRQKGNPDLNDVPEGLCPNCWGREEYGGHFYKSVKKQNTSINSKNPNIGWIQDYANKNLSGIEVKHQHDDGLVCEKCTVGYKPA